MRIIPKLALLTIGLPCTFLLSAPAQAGFLNAYEGFSVFGDGAGQCWSCDATVSFAVWNNTDGDWTDDLPDPVALVGSTASSSGADYVYLYQVANTSPLGGDNLLENFNISFGSQGAGVTPNPFTSGGYLDGWVFSKFSDALTPLDLPNDGTPSLVTDVTGPTLASFVTNSGAVVPNGLDFGNVAVPSVGGGADYPGALFQWDVNNKIDDTSTVVYLTSDFAPSFKWAATAYAGGFGAAGDVPSVVPLPTSVWLFGASLIAVISLARRKPS